MVCLVTATWRRLLESNFSRAVPSDAWPCLQLSGLNTVVCPAPPLGDDIFPGATARVIAWMTPSLRGDQLNARSPIASELSFNASRPPLEFQMKLGHICLSLWNQLLELCHAFRCSLGVRFIFLGKSYSAETFYVSWNAIRGQPVSVPAAMGEWRKLLRSRYDNG